MNQHFLPSLIIIVNNNQLTADILKQRINFLPKNVFLLLTSLILLTLPVGIKAQETLMGMTSAGGAEGKGTIFTFKTNATAFTIVKSLPDWGKTPLGGLIKGPGADANYYGMT